MGFMMWSLVIVIVVVGVAVLSIRQQHGLKGCYPGMKHLGHADKHSSTTPLKHRPYSALYIDGPGVSLRNETEFTVGLPSAFLRHCAPNLPYC